MSSGDILRAEVMTGSARGRELYQMMADGKPVPNEVVDELLAEAMLKRVNSSKVCLRNPDIVNKLCLHFPLFVFRASWLTVSHWMRSRPTLLSRTLERPRWLFCWMPMIQSSRTDWRAGNECLCIGLSANAVNVTMDWFSGTTLMTLTSPLPRG